MHFNSFSTAAFAIPSVISRLGETVRKAIYFFDLGMNDEWSMEMQGMWRWAFQLAEVM